MRKMIVGLLFILVTGLFVGAGVGLIASNSAQQVVASGGSNGNPGGG